MSSKAITSGGIKVSGLTLNELKTAVGYVQDGLPATEAGQRLLQYGYNEIASEQPLTPFQRIWNNIKNPLVILLATLGVISFLTGDIRSTVVVFLMVFLGIVLRYVQETRADKAAEQLKAMVSTHATVLRDGKVIELPLRQLVPGDTIQLGSGDMVPADVRLLTAKDLFLNQSALTGESIAVEKSANESTKASDDPLDAENSCFLGSNVESGTATAMVVNTGNNTNFGNLATHIVGQQESTSFDKGINKFTWLMIRFIMVMVRRAHRLLMIPWSLFPIK